MRGFVAIIATAFFLLAPPASLLHSAAAQVNNSSLDGVICTDDGQAPGPNFSCGSNILAGATVRLSKPGPVGGTVGGYDQTVTADANARYHFGSLADGDYVTDLKHTGFADVSFKVTVKAATTQDFLMAGNKISGVGKLVSDNGSAVADADINVCCSSQMGSTDAVTASDGSFKFTTTSGWRTFGASPAGFQTVKTFLFVDGSQPVALKAVALPPQDATVRGRVTDQDGNAVAGMQIQIYSNGGCCQGGPCCYAQPQPAACAPMPPGSEGASCSMPVYYSGSNMTTSGNDGTYSIHLYGDQSVSVQANKDGYGSFYSNSYVGKGQTVTLDIQMTKYPAKTAHLVGHVTDAKTGAALHLVQISVQSPQFGLYECSDGGSIYPTTATTATPMPPAGSGTATASADASPAMYPYPGPSGNSCSISILDDGRYQGMLTPGYAIVRADYEAGRSCVTTTNADHSSVTTCGPDYFPWLGSLNLTANADNTLDIALMPKPRIDATVSGYLIDGTSHRAIKSGSISFYNLDNGASGTAMTDKDGSYKVGLRSGYHQVTVQMEGYFLWQGVLDVPAGDSPFDVVLTRGQSAGGCYRYCVMDASGKGAPAPAMEGAGTHVSSTPTGTGSVGTTPGAASGGSGSLVEDLHGGLGPYDPAMRAKATLAASPASAGGKSSPHLELIAVVGVLGLLAMMRRRLST